MSSEHNIWSFSEREHQELNNSGKTKTRLLPKQEDSIATAQARGVLQNPLLLPLSQSPPLFPKGKIITDCFVSVWYSLPVGVPLEPVTSEALLCIVG